MFELSGKVKENANGKHSVGYGFFWVAHNAMLSYFTACKKQMRWRVFGDVEDQMMTAKIHSSSQEML
jgi:hypothetical protein